jgi:CspA family cold shock protein
MKVHIGFCLSQKEELFRGCFLWAAQRCVGAGVFLRHSPPSNPSRKESGAVVEEQQQERIQGTVKWFSDRKGYGFIVREGGDDVFVHYTGIRAGGPRSLWEGDKVDFVIQNDPRGPRAVDLIVTEAAERPSYSRW